MTVDRHALHELVDELPDDQVAIVLADVRRHMPQVKSERPWPPAFFGMGVDKGVRLSALMILCDTGPLVAAAVRSDVHYDDLPLGTTDASVIALGERLDVREIATLDHRHPRVVRPAHVDAFTLLPEVA